VLARKIRLPETPDRPPATSLLPPNLGAAVSRKVLKRLDDFEMLAVSGAGRPAGRGRGWKILVGILAFMALCTLGALLVAFLKG
jgi:hypothetical protein